VVPALLRRSPELEPLAQARRTEIQAEACCAVLGAL
jgi:hypothetical protein